ncbi:pyridoxamine 5'-phosphate oxidase family protein [Peribacillus sp. SCS-155]|uniref:pyridoxamine 5'-phosphate oxidase family protein n=1 Tax=Peribacillus sedimenti TaxID=3115297 RepID=UPI003906C316
MEMFLVNARTGFLGLADEKLPYVVPLNFVYYNRAIYIHGAAHGRKIDIIGRNSNACFTVSEDLGTLTDPVPAKTDTSYMSVMLFGHIQIVTDLNEATSAMQEMLNKYVPGYYHSPLSKSHVEKYRSSLGSRTAVLKLVPESISAKLNEVNEAAKFYPGKTALDKSR